MFPNDHLHGYDELSNHYHFSFQIQIKFFQMQLCTINNHYGLIILSLLFEELISIVFVLSYSGSLG